MTNMQWTLLERRSSSRLADRVAFGGIIWFLGRFVLGGLFLMSGVEKLVGLDQFAASLVKGGIPDSIAPLLAIIAAAVETIGGFFIVIGFATTPASFLLIVFTIVAAFIAHRFWEFEGADRMMQMNHFTKNIMIVASFCLLYVAGGGPYSIDRWRRMRR